MAFEGKSGDNYTGATVGGFEISDTAYLTAGSVDIDSTAKYSAGQDIFVGVVSKSTDAVKVNKITNYTAGQGTTDTPQFVKLEQTVICCYGIEVLPYITRRSMETEIRSELSIVWPAICQTAFLFLREISWSGIHGKMKYCSSIRST